MSCKLKLKASLSEESFHHQSPPQKLKPSDTNWRHTPSSTPCFKFLFQPAHSPRRFTQNSSGCTSNNVCVKNSNCTPNNSLLFRSVRPAKTGAKWPRVVAHTMRNEIFDEPNAPSHHPGFFTSRAICYHRSQLRLLAGGILIKISA